MTKNKKLILHIGFHKTGSSAIQSHFFSHQKELLNIGWSLFCTRPDGSLSPRGNANIWMDFSGEAADFTAKLNPGIYTLLKKQTTHTILSIEELGWLYRAEDIQDIYNNLSKIFSEITVVCYIRRQDEHLLSHYQQGFKSPHSSAKAFYGDRLCVIPDHQDYYQRYLDYSAKLDNWAVAFGKENIQVRIFSKESLFKADTVQDFVSNFLPEYDMTRYQPQITNESVNFIQVILNSSLFNYREGLWYELGRKGFTNDPTFNYNVKAKLSSDTSQAILKHYTESNKRLKTYLPNLPQNWITPETPTHSEPIGSELRIEDYQATLTALISYYDEMTFKQFLKVKLQRLYQKLGFTRRIRF